MTQSHLRLFGFMLLMLVLSIIPFFKGFLGARPPFVLMAILYVQFYAPSLLGISWLLVVGILLDMMLGAVLGEHGLALALVIWISSTKARRFRLFSVGQQMGLVAVFAMIYASIIGIIEACFGHHLPLFGIVFTGFLAVLCWPWIRLVQLRTV